MFVPISGLARLCPVKFYPAEFIHLKKAAQKWTKLAKIRKPG
jgi:hypothetical protein